MKPTEPVTPRTEAGKALLGDADNHKWGCNFGKDIYAECDCDLAAGILEIENQARALAEDELLGDVEGLSRVLHEALLGCSNDCFDHEGRRTHGRWLTDEAERVLRAWRQSREGNGG